MLRDWHRQPPGKAYQTLVTNRTAAAPGKFRTDLLMLEEEEFIEALRAENVSDHMIDIQLPYFRVLKAQQVDRRKALLAKRAAAKGREIDDDLSPYLEADNRRRRRRQEATDGEEE